MSPSPDIIVLYAIAAVSLGMSVFILLKNARSVVHRSFALFLLGLAVTIVGFAFLVDERPFLLYDRMIHYGGLTLLLGLLVFAKVFPSGTKFPRRLWPLFMPFVAVAAVIPFDLIIRQSSFDAGRHVMPVNGPLFVPYIVFWAAYVIIPLCFLAHTYRTTRGKERSQMHYLFAGLVLLLASFLLFNLILPFFGVSSLFFMSAVSAVAMILFASYAIVRHELLDIRIRHPARTHLHDTLRRNRKCLHRRRRDGSRLSSHHHRNERPHLRRHRDDYRRVSDPPA